MSGALDTAIEYARNGEIVVYWTVNHERARNAYMDTVGTIPSLSGVHFSPQCLEIRWPNYGRILFAAEPAHMHLRGMRIGVVIEDGAYMPLPERVFAHTVISTMDGVIDRGLRTD